MPRPEPRAFIQQNLRLQPAPSVPEIMLYAAHSGSGLRRLLGRDNDVPPYWAYHWAGGTVLARYLFDRPDTVAGRRVLDLGSGSGLVAITAMKCSASHATAIDIDPTAVIAAELNAAANDVRIETVCADILGNPPADNCTWQRTPSGLPAISPTRGERTRGTLPASIEGQRSGRLSPSPSWGGVGEGSSPQTQFPWDIILVGDLFYDVALARKVLPFLATCRDAGIDILIGGPNRTPLPHSELKLLAEYLVPDFGDAQSGAQRVSGVFTLKDRRPD